MAHRTVAISASQINDRIKAAFWNKVEKTDSCWIWTGARMKYGYGRANIGRGTIRFAHRVSYALFHGEAPDSLVIDHLCRVPQCVRPEHLEAVTQRENVMRSSSPAAFHSKKTHCPYGHPYADENLRVYAGSRNCIICIRERYQASKRRIQALSPEEREKIRIAKNIQWCISAKARRERRLAGSD